MLHFFLAIFYGNLSFDLLPEEPWSCGCFWSKRTRNQPLQPLQMFLSHHFQASKSTILLASTANDLAKSRPVVMQVRVHRLIEPSFVGPSSSLIKTQQSLMGIFS